MEKKTPLYDCHVALGGKIVPFAGYLLPVQYPTGVITEHMAVRTKAGLFDVSHMAELVLEGPDALKNANNLTTVFVDEMADGQVKYSPMCNEQGGIVDDLMVYRLKADKYLFVVNAANHEKDYAFMKAHITGRCDLHGHFRKCGAGGATGACFRGDSEESLPGGVHSHRLLYLCGKGKDHPCFRQSDRGDRFQNRIYGRGRV